jgi:hypothetical protein
MICVLKMFRICSALSVNVQNLFRLCSVNAQNLFRIFSQRLVNVQNVQNLFRIFCQCSECSIMFRLCSEYLAQKLVCSEFLDFVVVGYKDCRWNCGSVWQFIMNVDGIVVVFSSL